MKVYISADMEGVTGVTHPQDEKGIFAIHILPANPVFHRRQFSTILAL